jgi:hypothetical protein
MERRLDRPWEEYRSILAGRAAVANGASASAILIMGTDVNLKSLLQQRVFLTFVVHQLLAEDVEAGIELPPPRFRAGTRRRESRQLRCRVKHLLVLRAQFVCLGSQPGRLADDFVEEPFVLFMPKVFHERRVETVELSRQFVARRVVRREELVDVGNALA